MENWQTKQRSQSSSGLDSSPLCLISSNNSSLESYSSSIADSTVTKNSTQSSFTGRVKNLISRRRSQSLNVAPLSNSLTRKDSTSSESSTLNKFKLLRNKSFISTLPPSLPSLIPSSSSSSSRDNSISSLSEFDFELASPSSPLGRIDESSAENFGKERKKSINNQLTETDIKVYDDIADNILDKVASERSTVEWHI